MSREPSSARTRSARSRAACGSEPYSAATRQSSSSTGAAEPGPGSSTARRSAARTVSRCSARTPAAAGSTPRLVGDGDEQFHAERVPVRRIRRPRRLRRCRRWARRARTGPPVRCASTARRSCSAVGAAGSGSTGVAREDRRDPFHQVGDERAAPGRPGGGPGGQRVGLGEGVQQFQGAARADGLGDRAHGRRVVQVAPGRGVDEQQVVAYEGGEDGHVVGGRSRSGRPRRGRWPRRPREWSPGQPLPMSCSRAATSSRSGRPTRRVSDGGPHGGLHQVPVDGPAVHGVALRAAADPLPVGQQPGDQALRLQGLPDRRRSDSPAPSRVTSCSRASAGQGTGSGRARGGQARVPRAGRAAGRPGRRRRRRAAAARGRVSGRAARASTTSPSCSTTPSASGVALGGRLAAAAAWPRSRGRADRARSTRLDLAPGDVAGVGDGARRPRTPGAAGRRRPAGRVGRRPASCSWRASRSVARPVVRCSASRTSRSRARGLVEPFARARRRARTRRRRAARWRRAVRRGPP